MVLLKFLLIVGLAAFVWWLTTAKKQPPTIDRLVRCEQCGAYHEKDKPCSCQQQ